MNEELRKTLESIRELAYSQKLLNYSISEASKSMGVPVKQLKKLFADKT